MAVTPSQARRSLLGASTPWWLSQEKPSREISSKPLVKAPAPRVGDKVAAGTAQQGGQRGWRTPVPPPQSLTRALHRGHSPLPSPFSICPCTTSKLTIWLQPLERNTWGATGRSQGGQWCWWRGWVHDPVTVLHAELSAWQWLEG